MSTTPSIAARLAAEEPGKPSVSFEYFPPRSEKAEETLMVTNLPLFAKQQPVFFDMTWGAGGATSGKTMMYCKQIQEQYPDIPVNMHLTCVNMPQGLIKETLEFAKANGIRNILALRGDPPANEAFQVNPDGFACALDLVKYIKANYGDLFCITVAGYPEGHPTSLADDGFITDEKYQREIDYLRAKVNAGASLIITQLFYDVSIFVKFVKKCRECGITVPILPGMLPVSNYGGLKRMVELCKTYVPAEMKAKVEELQDEPEELMAYGIQQSAQMIKDIIAADIGVNHFHFYTINTTKATLQVMKEVGIYKE